MQGSVAFLQVAFGLARRRQERWSQEELWVLIQVQCFRGPTLLKQAQFIEAGSVLPTSNPFYSDRAKAEIELLHNRPATLDEEGLRLGVEVDEAALGDSVVNFSQEPNYGAFLDVPGPSDENPRVARVEASAGEQVLPMPEGGAPKPFSPLSGKGRGTSGAVPGLSGRSEPSAMSGAVSGLSDSTRPDLLEVSRAAPGLGGMARDGPPVVDDDRDDDQAELIPAAEDGRLQKMEVLLAQVLEENQLLKNKLSTESQSSWYSQRTVQGDGLGQCSPASIAHGYGVSPVGPCGSRDFTGDYLDPMGGMVGPSFGFPGQQLSVNRARLQQAQLAGAFELS